MNTPQTIAHRIELPRLDGERGERYAARVAYITAGADRSLAHTATAIGKPVSLLERWSVADGWVELAAQYDETLANLAAAAAAQQYMADLEQHRIDSMTAGRELVELARAMLAEIKKKRRELEYTPASVAAAARALTIGLDLQAHGLQVAELLPRLTPESHDDHSE